MWVLHPNRDYFSRALIVGRCGTPGARPSSAERGTRWTLTVRSDDTRAVGWWRALNSPWGIFWSGVTSALVALALDVARDCPRFG
jgi:hypothetical protein